MATTPRLLSLPLEIRHQIYFFLLPSATKINMVRDDMDGPLRTSLFRICRQVYREAFPYYYSTNAFVLDLTEPAYAPNKFVNGTKGLLKYIRRVKSLELLIGDSTSAKDGVSALSEYAREQVNWFLRTIQQANENHGGLWLRDLILLDYCETSIPKEITSEMLERGEKRREALVSLLKPFRVRIESSLRIESRALSDDRKYYDPLCETYTGILAADTPTLVNVTKSGIGQAWKTVLGVSHMHPNIAPSGSESPKIISPHLNTYDILSPEQEKEATKVPPMRIQHTTTTTSAHALSFDMDQCPYSPSAQRS